VVFNVIIAKNIIKVFFTPLFEIIYLLCFVKQDK